MNRKRLVIVLVVVSIGLLIGLWKLSHAPVETNAATQATKSPAPSSPLKSQAQQAGTPPQGIVLPDVPGRKLSDQDKVNIAKIVQVFSAPIDFWGKVVDQHGDPIAGAAVHYSAADKYFKDGTKYEGTSDANGLFSISNIRGAGLFVNVAKRGYYGTAKSGRSFGYGMPSGASPPSKLQPAIFVLHKMGETEPLMELKTGSVLVSKAGTPKKISLRHERGRLPETSGGDLQVEVWSDYEPPPVFQKSYDWRCRITVPGGGLVEREPGFDFEAPADGYVSTFEFSMPAGAERWNSNVERDFFLRLADGCYARTKLNVIAGGGIVFRFLAVSSG